MTEDTIMMTIYMVSNIITILVAIWFVLSPKVKTNSFEICGLFAICISNMSDVEQAMVSWPVEEPLHHTLFHVGVAFILVTKFYYLEVKNRRSHAHNRRAQDIHG